MATRTNRILDDYLRDLRAQLGGLDAAQRDQVLADIRTHLDDKVAEIRRADPALSPDEAALKATHDFGDPQDIGVAYGAGGGVVRKSTGEVLLRVAALTGKGVVRTVGGVLKWTLIALLVLLALGAAIAIALVFTAGGLLKAYEDEIASSIPRPIYSYQESWDLPDAETALRTDAFQVSTDATGFDLLIEITPDTGCLAVQVVGPDGAVAYTNNQGCEPTRQQLHFAQQGSWRIQYSFAAFTGSVDVGAYEYRPGTPG